MLSKASTMGSPAACKDLTDHHLVNLKQQRATIQRALIVETDISLATMIRSSQKSVVCQMDTTYLVTTSTIFSPPTINPEWYERLLHLCSIFYPTMAWFPHLACHCYTRVENAFFHRQIVMFGCCSNLNSPSPLSRLSTSAQCQA